MIQRMVLGGINFLNGYLIFQWYFRTKQSFILKKLIISPNHNKRGKIPTFYIRRKCSVFSKKTSQPYISIIYIENFKKLDKVGLV